MHKMQIIGKNLSALFLATLFLGGCRNVSECKPIKDNQYRGYAIAFYNKPISGNLIELTIIPVCSDTVQLDAFPKVNVKELGRFPGIKLIIGMWDSTFMRVFKGAKKMHLSHSEDLAFNLRDIYVCPIYIDFNGAEDITKATLGNNQKFIVEKIVFDNGLQVSFKSFLSGRINVSVIRVI